MFGDSSDDEDHITSSDVATSSCTVALDSEVGRQRALEVRPPGAGVLAFHNGVEEALLLHVEKTSKKGDVDDILRAVDIFCYSRHWMMHVGDFKGLVLRNILQRSPVVDGRGDLSLCAVELGSYCGYSTALIAKQLPVNVKLFTVENNLKCQKFTERMLRHAELISNVCIAESIPEAIAAIKQLELRIGFIFIDHDKSRYTSDLKLFENSGLMLSPGCVVLADNILSFGVPLNDFIDHVSESNDMYASYELMRGAVEYSVASDTVPTGDAHEDAMCVAIYK